MLSDADIRRLHRYALSLCGDSHEAFDLVQTAFEKVLKSRPDFAGLSLSYFYTTVRHCFIDSLRAQKSQPVMEGHSDVDEVPNLSVRALDDLMIERATLDEILTDLTPWERELLFLHLVEERTAEEIGVTTGKPRGTILSMMHRIRRKIIDRNSRADRRSKR